MTPYQTPRRPRAATIARMARPLRSTRRAVDEPAISLADAKLSPASWAGPAATSLPRARCPRQPRCDPRRSSCNRLRIRGSRCCGRSTDQHRRPSPSGTPCRMHRPLVRPARRNSRRNASALNGCFATGWPPRARRPPTARLHRRTCPGSGADTAFVHRHSCLGDRLVLDRGTPRRARRLATRSSPRCRRGRCGLMSLCWCWSFRLLTTCSTEGSGGTCRPFSLSRSRRPSRHHDVTVATLDAMDATRSVRGKARAARPSGRSRRDAATVLTVRDVKYGARVRGHHLQRAVSASVDGVTV